MKLVGVTEALHFDGLHESKLHRGIERHNGFAPDQWTFSNHRLLQLKMAGASIQITNVTDTIYFRIDMQTDPFN